ncbi:choice-of-anchor F family protein [Marinobacter sp. DUT-1]|uniref:choice-of-anchor F family protein n=1 Tax=Marinobacter sp. DUT-1 TaxID=3412037 RepID=UPI003D171932
MRATKTKFVRKPLAAAVMCSAIGLSPAVFGATIESVNTDNLSVPPVEGKTLVYTDTAGTASFGWLDPVNDSGDIGLGISVYNESFSGTIDEQVYEFAGCIMAQPDLEVNCRAPGDSGKRFKLKTTETNGPIDLVFNVAADDASKLYRVIGKFSNLTDGTLQGFRFETGFGVGNDFMASSAADGLSFGMVADGSSKLSVGPVGKYPGGLFGGSKVEGLPFFSTSIAEFTEGPSATNEDVLETDGVIPAQYSDLFGDWVPLAQVPTGWFIDHDGNPANDSILLAYEDPVTDAEDWKTFQKNFQDVVVETRDLDGDPATAEIEINAQNYDPNGDSFATVLDETGNPTTIDVSDVQPLVDTLDEGDPEGAIPDAITLTSIGDASTLFVQDYNGTGEGFKLLIDGKAVPIAAFDTWAANPPKVLDGNGDLYATWFADEGEDGLYQLASDSSWVTVDEMNAEIAASSGDLERVPGYVQGPVEDLANVNVNTSISVADTSTWPTCTGDGNETNCTFTVRVTGLNDAADVPVIPATPIPKGDGPIFGCSAGKPGSPFDPVLPSMVLAALAGLWARKRRGTA